MEKEKSLIMVLILIVSSGILPVVTAINMQMNSAIEENTAIIEKERSNNTKTIDQLIADHKADIRTMTLKNDLELTAKKDANDREIKEAEKSIVDEYDLLSNVIADCREKNWDMLQFQIDFLALDNYINDMVNNGGGWNESTGNATLTQWIVTNYANPIQSMDSSLFSNKFSLFYSDVYESIYTVFDLLTVYSVVDKLSPVYIPSEDLLKQAYDYYNYPGDYNGYDNESFSPMRYFTYEFNITNLENGMNSYLINQFNAYYAFVDQKNNEYNQYYNITRQWIGSNETKNQQSELTLATQLRIATDEKERIMVTDLANAKKLVDASVALLGFAIALFSTGMQSTEQTQEDKDNAEIMRIRKREEPAKKGIFKKYVMVIFGLFLLAIGITLIVLGLGGYLSYVSTTGAELF